MRVAIAALGALGLVALLVVPFHPEASLLGAVYHFAPQGLDPYVWGIVEWGGNVLSFALLSAMLCLPLRPRHAFLLATVISAACETVQLFIPDRQPSLSDFLLNTTGAAIACGICAGIARLHRAIKDRRVRLRSASA